jgi:hypothetical protein
MRYVMEGLRVPQHTIVKYQVPLTNAFPQPSLETALRDQSVCDFLNDIINSALWLPCRVIPAKFVCVANPPNVVAHPSYVSIMSAASIDQ